MPKKGRQKRTDIAVITAIERLAKKGSGPAAIQRHLKDDVKLRGLVIPHIKTIQKIVRENTPVDPSAPWQLAEASGEDAALVLPVLAAMIEASEGRLTTISNARAEWIVKLRRVAIDLPPWPIYELAHVYMLRGERQDATDDLDAFLAFAPWRNKENDRRYYGLMKRLGMVMYAVTRHGGGSIIVRESDDDITYADLFNLSELAPAAAGETEQQKEKGR